MAKVKIKVSGCSRTLVYAEYRCRISSYLQSMAATGCNPLVAIQIALAGRAAEMVKQTPNPDLNRERVSRYLCVFISIILVFLINNRHKRFFIGDELAMVVSGHERGRTGKAIEATETVLTDSNRAECHFS